MDKNEIIPRGPLDCVDECKKCKKISRLHLMEITIHYKTDQIPLCIDCFEKIIEIAFDE